MENEANKSPEGKGMEEGQNEELGKSPPHFDTSIGAWLSCDRISYIKEGDLMRSKNSTRLYIKGKNFKEGRSVP